MSTSLYARRDRRWPSVVAALAAALLTALSANAEFENIPTEIGARDLLTRLAARGLVAIDTPHSEPLTRDHLRHATSRGAAALSQVERSHLAAYAAYAGGPADAVYRYQADGFAFAFDPWVSFDLQRFTESNRVATATAVRPVAYGGTSAFRFYTEFEWGVVSKPSRYVFPPGKFALRQRSITGDLEQINMVRGHVAFGSGPVVAQFGKIPVRWGMAAGGSLLLSDNADARDGLRLLARPGPFTFESLTAAMPHVGAEKYISAHRLSVRPHPRLVVGVHEAVVYSGSLQLNYVNPFNLYLLSVPIVERQTRGEDREAFPGGNTLFGGDATWRVGESNLVYADILVDDFQPQKGLASLRNWDSKFATQLGVYAADPLGLADVAARAEYTFVNQYAYTHEFDVLRYTLGGDPLGFFTGPDADDIYLRAEKWLSPRARVALRGRQTRKGEQEITEPHARGGPERWSFISGVPEVRRSVGVGLRLSQVAQWAADVNVDYVHVTDVGHARGATRRGLDVALSGSYRL